MVIIGKQGRRARRGEMKRHDTGTLAPPRRCPGRVLKQRGKVDKNTPGTRTTSREMLIQQGSREGNARLAALVALHNSMKMVIPGSCATRAFSTSGAKKMSTTSKNRPAQQVERNETPARNNVTGAATSVFLFSSGRKAGTTSTFRPTARNSKRAFSTWTGFRSSTSSPVVKDHIGGRAPARQHYFLMWICGLVLLAQHLAGMILLLRVREQEQEVEIHLSPQQLQRNGSTSRDLLREDNDADNKMWLIFVRAVRQDPPNINRQSVVEVGGGVVVAEEQSAAAEEEESPPDFYDVAEDQRSSPVSTTSTPSVSVDTLKTHEVDETDQDVLAEAGGAGEEIIVPASSSSVLQEETSKPESTTSPQLHEEDEVLLSPSWTRVDARAQNSERVHEDGLESSTAAGAGAPQNATTVVKISPLFPNGVTSMLQLIEEGPVFFPGAAEGKSILELMVPGRRSKRRARHKIKKTKKSKSAQHHHQEQHHHTDKSQGKASTTSGKAGATDKITEKVSQSSEQKAEGGIKADRQGKTETAESRGEEKNLEESADNNLHLDEHVESFAVTYEKLQKECYTINDDVGRLSRAREMIATARVRVSASGDCDLQGADCMEGMGQDLACSWVFDNIAWTNHLNWEKCAKLSDQVSVEIGCEPVPAGESAINRPGYIRLPVHALNFGGLVRDLMKPLLERMGAMFSGGSASSFMARREGEEGVEKWVTEKWHNMTTAAGFRRAPTTPPEERTRPHKRPPPRKTLHSTTSDMWTSAADFFSKQTNKMLHPIEHLKDEVGNFFSQRIPPLISALLSSHLVMFIDMLDVDGSGEVCPNEISQKVLEEFEARVIDPLVEAFGAVKLGPLPVGELVASPLRRLWNVAASQFAVFLDTRLGYVVNEVSRTLVFALDAKGGGSSGRNGDHHHPHHHDHHRHHHHHHHHHHHRHHHHHHHHHHHRHHHDHHHGGTGNVVAKLGAATTDIMQLVLFELLFPDAVRGKEDGGKAALDRFREGTQKMWCIITPAALLARAQDLAASAKKILRTPLSERKLVEKLDPRVYEMLAKMESTELYAVMMRVRTVLRRQIANPKLLTELQGLVRASFHREQKKAKQREKGVTVLQVGDEVVDRFPRRARAPPGSMWMKEGSRARGGHAGLYFAGPQEVVDFELNDWWWTSTPAAAEEPEGEEHVVGSTMLELFDATAHSAVPEFVTAYDKLKQSCYSVDDVDRVGRVRQLLATAEAAHSITEGMQKGEGGKMKQCEWVFDNEAWTVGDNFDKCAKLSEQISVALGCPRLKAKAQIIANSGFVRMPVLELNFAGLVNDVLSPLYKSVKKKIYKGAGELLKVAEEFLVRNVPRLVSALMSSHLALFISFLDADKSGEVCPNEVSDKIIDDFEKRVITPLLALFSGISLGGVAIGGLVVAPLRSFWKVAASEFGVFLDVRLGDLMNDVAYAILVSYNPMHSVHLKLRDHRQLSLHLPTSKMDADSRAVRLVLLELLFPDHVRGKDSDARMKVLKSFEDPTKGTKMWCMPTPTAIAQSGKKLIEDVKKKLEDPKLLSDVERKFQEKLQFVPNYLFKVLGQVTATIREKVAGKENRAQLKWMLRNSLSAANPN
ncbi:unnamed protein product [Amoebophrya sp. A120]|nr:unnamed protein product [Amoebophrya sp. A120]|eukprot:GSA120T00011259001.1